LIERRFKRYPVLSLTLWDYFSDTSGPREGLLTDISRGGCLLKTNELIEPRRWLRMIARSRANLHVTLVGRVLRCENVIEAHENSVVTLYRYGIEFTYPADTDGVLPQEPDLIFALSSRNLTVLSCLNRNSKSSRRPGFRS
jgi:hypothetical protein